MISFDAKRNAQKWISGWSNRSGIWAFALNASFSFGAVQSGSALSSLLYAERPAIKNRLSNNTFKFDLVTFLCSITHIGNQAKETTLEFVASPKATA